MTGVVTLYSDFKRTLAVGAAAHVHHVPDLAEEAVQILLRRPEWQVAHVNRLAVVLDDARPPRARRRIPLPLLLLVLPPPALSACSRA